jgi:signal transduction histidine kinase
MTDRVKKTLAFDRFTRAESSRTSSGAGLGLAIAKAVVDAHGGTITVGRREGGGAEVSVWIPGRIAGAPDPD